ncbi:MAG: hypothetical protein U0457_19335 [Candidatus Sericytochromatia bacterium]
MSIKSFNELPYITIIEAPYGYGKTTYINKILEFNKYDNLFLTGKNNNLEIKIVNNFLRQETKKILIIDNLDLFNNKNEILFLLEKYLFKEEKDLRILISSNKKLNLAIENLPENSLFLDIDFFKLKETDFTNILKNYKLKIEETDIIFFNYVDGWILAINLYLKLKLNRISKKIFDSTLEKSINSLLNKDINYENKDIFFINQLPNIFKPYIQNIFIDNEKYWEKLSIDSKNILDSLILLERAKKISLSKKENILNFITREIYYLFILSEYHKIDILIEEGDKYIHSSTLDEKLYFLYHKANYYRFLCQHDKVFEIVNEIIDVNSNNKKILKLQNKAYVLLGLTYYQKGEYNKTRENYKRAILLAEKSFDFELTNEIKIMLSFLDIFEGKDSNLDINEIEVIINNSKEKNQPLMLLNFAFCLILGEKLDITKGLEIINKTKNLANNLEHKYLLPLIYDIEARIYRYSKQHEKALDCHNKALSLIKKDSFDFFQANLNYVLTLIKTDKHKGESILNNLIIETKAKGLFGITRQIETVLQDFYSNKNNDNYNYITNDKLSKEIDLPAITINTFGKFEVSISDNEINDWKRKKTKKLLAYLITNQKGIHRESLAENLFSSENTENTLKNLDVNIHSLKKALEPERKQKGSSFILFRDSCYSFNWNYPYKFDFIDFEKAYLNWEKEKKEDKKINLATQIINIYKGDFLSEIDFSDDWEDQREYFFKKFLDVAIWLTNIYLDNLNYDKTEEILNKIIKFDKVNETAYILIMEMSEQKKDFELLNKTFEKAEFNFKKEFNSHPTDEIKNTFNKIYSKFNLKI